MNGNKSVTAAFTVQTQTVWQSHNTRMQSGSPQATITSDEGGVTANLEFYESTNDDGVIKGSLFSTFTTGIHPETFNNVKAYWTNGTAQYPYAGTSTIIRGSDAGEANTPSPAGVLDLQMHPPSNLHLTVGAFIVPAGGTFTASNLAVRRVSSSGASAILKLFNSSKELIATLTATNSRVWVTDDKIYDLGNLAAGDRIYFAIDNADNYNNDATELFFTVTQKTKLATQSHFSSKSDPIKNLGISTIVTNKGFYFTLPRAAEYSLSIFTLNGIKVAEIIKARGMYGQNVVPLRIPNGIYLARLSTGANTIDREIQVLK
jgi:hypothetical protein